MKVLVCIGSSCHKKGSYRVQERLKELVGHTPIQVMAGALLGILVGALIA